VRLTPSTAPICSTVSSRASYILRACRTCSVDSLLGRPPTRPRARAAVSPATVRSRMISRSNWASAPNRWNTSRPPAVVVSMFSRSDRNPTPRASSAVTTSIRCRSDRPSRSSRHTTNVSPGRKGNVFPIVVPGGEQLPG